MISFVPGVYSGLTAEPENEKGDGSCSYPSDFMDDHGPLACLDDDDTFRETVFMLLRLIRVSSKYNICCYHTYFLNNVSISNIDYIGNLFFISQFNLLFS